MKTQTQYMLAILLLLVSYGHTKASELDYSTEQIREMWQACSYNFQINFPQISERIRWPLCYCYMDHLRKTYSSLRVKTLSDNESMTIVLGVAKICVIPKDLLNKPEKLFNKPEVTLIRNYLIKVA